MSDPIILKIDGMSCSGCVSAVEAATARAAPGATITASLERGEVRVEGGGEPAAIAAAIENAGYDVIRG